MKRTVFGLFSPALAFLVSFFQGSIVRSVIHPLQAAWNFFNLTVTARSRRWQRHSKQAYLRISTSILLWQIFFPPASAMAETIEMVCIHREYRMTLRFKVDTLHNTVVHDSLFAREVHIDKSTISFVVDLASGEYFHFISRQSGNMTMKAPHGTLIYGFACDAVTMKF